MFLKNPSILGGFFLCFPQEFAIYFGVLPKKDYFCENKINMLRKCIILAMIAVSVHSCNSSKARHDASGIFEATEIIVFAEASGRLEVFDLKEGVRLAKGQQVGYIDSTQLYLKKMQLLAAQKTLAAQIDSMATTVNGFDEKFRSLIEQVNDELAKCRIVNPVEGTVLSKYAQTEEIVITGKALYKIANLREMFLWANVPSGQLEKLSVGQEASVYVTASDGSSRKYPGKVTWISDKAAPMPKTMQTQGERQELVYVVKIAVANTDGLIKNGMFGDVGFAR